VLRGTLSQSLATLGRCEIGRSLLERGTLSFTGCRVRALGHRLISPTPQRPPQPKVPLLFRPRHGNDHSPDLRHRRRDQLGVETRLEIPLLLTPSSCSATERTTAR
jgi:hypothetical protein